METVTGVVLAAGAGRRAGGPKALRRDASGIAWVELAVRRLEAVGCAPVLVVVGAQAERARLLVPPSATVVVAADWHEGLSASLRAGLAGAVGSAALVTLVDLPDEPAAVGARLLSAVSPEPWALARAVFGGRPGHPVLLGRAHWAALVGGAGGDSGARELLRMAGAREIECGDLWSGVDRDGPR
ncbi:MULTISPECIES: nucleotidyltransferase family protein [unclassified Rathayibacter]|uniref:nucleotidyltransferase family protein n=1 Tax=unclassified Rathayibacter TaxID=2609250 RepID=UPI00188B0CBD|nr:MULTISPECIES: NTP transferase domain-containing protein [unclassified Rathayibacter]MBF4462129.1 NTP transferase domain-containing protein [Rathayibacter sp. VKM Ac-2879]MBF4503828.1 NTP transferase domain-containing protein [Rathayibacter sp. VKM Ac-2878]